MLRANVFIVIVVCPHAAHALLCIRKAVTLLLWLLTTQPLVIIHRAPFPPMPLMWLFHRVCPQHVGVVAQLPPNFSYAVQQPAARPRGGKGCYG